MTDPTPTPDTAARRVALFLDVYESLSNSSEIYSVGSRVSNHETVALTVADLRSLLAAARSVAGTADERRETELWQVLDWSLWGNGLGDRLREAIADTTLTTLTDEQREQAEACIKAWHAGRGPSMAVGEGTALQKERDMLRERVAELEASNSQSGSNLEITGSSGTAAPQVTPMRYLLDGKGLTWRVYPGGRTEWWDERPRQWVPSSATAADLYSLGAVDTDPPSASSGTAAPDRQDDFHVGDIVRNRHTGGKLVVREEGTWLARFYELVACPHSDGSGTTAALTNGPTHGDIRPVRGGNDQVYLDGRGADGEPIGPASWYEIGPLCGGDGDE